VLKVALNPAQVGAPWRMAFGDPRGSIVMFACVLTLLGAVLFLVTDSWGRWVGMVVFLAGAFFGLLTHSWTSILSRLVPRRGPKHEERKEE